MLHGIASQCLTYTSSCLIQNISHREFLLVTIEVPLTYMTLFTLLYIVITFICIITADVIVVKFRFFLKKIVDI